MTKLAVLVASLCLLASSAAQAQFAIGAFEVADDNSLSAVYSGWACSTTNPSQTQQLLSILIKDAAGNLVAEALAGTASRPELASLCGGYATVGWSVIGWGGMRGTPLYAYARNNQTGQPQLLNGTPLYPRFWCPATNTQVETCCSVWFGQSTVAPGGTTTFNIESSGYLPAGSISYLYGTRNGAWDVYASPYAMTSGGFTITNSPGLAGTYTRWVVIVGPDNRALCSTPSATVVFQ